MDTARTGNCRRWKAAFIDLALDRTTNGYYLKAGRQVDWFYMLATAHRCGFPEITDENLKAVTTALRAHARAVTNEQAAVP